MSAPRLDLVLVAYQCGPDMGSVSQIGWNWFVNLVRRGHRVTLVTHSRNHASIAAALHGLPDVQHQADILYIDTEWLAGPLYRGARRLFPHSEHGVFMLSQLDYFAFDHAASRALRAQMKQGRRWQLVHIVTPVTASAPSRLHRLGMPVVRGPLNCGLPVPEGFGSVMKQDAMFLAKLRALPRLLDHLWGSLKSCEAVLVATEATLSSIPASARRNCVRMLENAVELDRFQPGPTLPPPGPCEPLRLAFVGRLVPVKALPLLFQAMAIVKAKGHALTLQVAGDGPMRPHWQRLADELGLADEVTWLGAVPHERVCKVIHDGHLFCLPSVRESGGAVLLEAMACERPVMALDFGGPAEIVDAEVGWLVSARNERVAIEGMADALLEAISKPETLSARGRHGRRLAETMHTWQARLLRAEALYRRVLLVRGQPVCDTAGQPG